MPGKTLKTQAQQFVLNLCEYFELEKRNGGPLEPLSSVQEVNIIYITIILVFKPVEIKISVFVTQITGWSLLFFLCIVNFRGQQLLLKFPEEQFMPLRKGKKIIPFCLHLANLGLAQKLKQPIYLNHPKWAFGIQYMICTKKVSNFMVYIQWPAISRLQTKKFVYFKNLFCGMQVLHVLKGKQTASDSIKICQYTREGLNLSFSLNKCRVHKQAKSIF